MMSNWRFERMPDFFCADVLIVLSRRTLAKTLGLVMFGTCLWAIVSSSSAVAQNYSVIARNSSTFLGSQSSGTYLYYSVYIPIGATDLRVRTTGTGGDVDLVVYNPAGTAICSRSSSSVNEECYIGSPSAGYWDIRVRYWSTSYNVYLTLNSTGGDDGNVIELNGSQTIDSLSQGDQALFTVQASGDFSAIRIGTRGGSGDVDLFCRCGQHADAIPII